MQKLHFSVHIQAPKKKVWDAMLQDKTYREWTTAFNPGSYYEGKWETGSKMLFLGPHPKTGLPSGMVSCIKESRPYEFVSIEHLGFVQDGVEDTTSDFIKEWVGALENYTFVEKNGGTEVQVDIDVADSQKDEFQGMWPKALELLKEISEK